MLEIVWLCQRTYLCVPRSFVRPTRHPTQVILESTRHTNLFSAISFGTPFVLTFQPSSGPVLLASRRKPFLPALKAPSNLSPPLQARGRRLRPTSSSNFPSQMDTTQFSLWSIVSLSVRISFPPSLLSLHQAPLNSSKIMSGLNTVGPRRSS